MVFSEDSLSLRIALGKAGPQKGIKIYAGTIFPDSSKFLHNALQEIVVRPVYDVIEIYLAFYFMYGH